MVSRGAVPSPNIWKHPATYEIENHAVDRGRLIESTMRSIANWADRDLLDLGCGTGFHLPRWASAPGGARTVTGVEPHPDLVRLATRRTRSLPQVRVLQGAAQDLPLPDGSIDVVQVRWAYFFGHGVNPA